MDESLRARAAARAKTHPKYSDARVYVRQTDAKITLAPDIKAMPGDYNASVRIKSPPAADMLSLAAVVLSLAGAGLAADLYHPAPAPYHPPPAPYHPPPAPYHPPHVPHDPYKIPPRPFAYEYGVKDEYSGAYFDKKETQDEYGVVAGEYRVALPDGRTQIVTYHADHENGYIADVKYEGEPRYDPYHPQPVVAYQPAPKPAPYHPSPKPAPYHPPPAAVSYHPKPAPYHPPPPAPYHPPEPAYLPKPVYHPKPVYPAYAPHYA